MQPFSFGIATLFFSSVAAAWLQAQVIAPGTTGWPNTYPTWWYNAADPANGVIDATKPILNQNNDALLLLGQLKHIASEARDELDSEGGAGPAVNTLVDDFLLNDPSNRSPANIGQLKAVSSVFFDRLAELSFTPSSPGWPSTLILDEGDGDNAKNYPWRENITPTNASLASIGQAKHLFSWDLNPELSVVPYASISTLPASSIGVSQRLTLHADDSTGPITTYNWDFGDGSPIVSGSDAQHRYLSHVYTSPGTYTVTLTVDYDETAPINQASTSVVITVEPFVDSDGDQIPDWWEVLYLLDPTDASDAIAMSEDGSGLSNLEEYEGGTSPTNSDTDGDGWSDSNELNWSWDGNFDQSQLNARYSSSGDFNRDGISNAAAVLNGKNPTDPESSGLEQPPQYAVIDLGANREFDALSDNGHVLSIVYSEDNHEDEAEIWHFGEKYTYDLFTFKGGQITDTGSVFGIDTDPTLVDEYGTVEGIQYPVADDCPQDIDNYFGEFITATLSLGASESELLKPDVELLSGDCVFFPEYAQRIAVSPDGLIVAGYAAVPVTLTHIDRFFFTAPVGNDGMGTIEKYTESDALRVAQLWVNNAGDLLYGYETTPGGNVEYGFNGNSLNVDRVYDLGQDGRILARNGKSVSLGSVSFEEASEPVGFSETQDRMTVLFSDVLYLQKVDENTGDPVPLNGAGSFTLYPINDICSNSSEWEELTADAISKDANLIVASAMKGSDNHLLLLLKVDLEASEYAEWAPSITASLIDGFALPFQLTEAQEMTEGIKVCVNNDDDDVDGSADMTQISGSDTNVTAENDSASLRITFPSIDTINSGTVSIKLEKTSGEFGARLWKDRFDKGYTMLVAAATQGIDLSPGDSNADIGVVGSSNGSTTKSWDLSDATEKADLIDIIQTRKILWLEGISTGEGKITLKLEFNGSVAFEDEIKVTVVAGKTIKNQRVAYADSVKAVKFGSVSNSDAVRNYHGDGDIIMPIAFYSGTEDRNEPSTYNELSISERDALKQRMEINGFRTYVVSKVTDDQGAEIASGLAFQDIGRMVVIADSSDWVYIHEHAHLLGQDHQCITDNFMWGLPECSGTPRGDATHVNQEQYDLVF